jgi:hypothetical protein
LPVLHPDAAGIDVGASELFVAVGADRDPQPVRRFPTFTRDLHVLADWLQQCGVRSVAMESTSVYWISIYQILEARGLEVCLVNAQHVKNVPGRKTDVSDCQWLQYLHSVGLLRASFRPPGAICAVRALWRHRGSLVQMAAEHIMHIQKAPDQMNLQVSSRCGSHWQRTATISNWCWKRIRRFSARWSNWKLPTTPWLRCRSEPSACHINGRGTSRVCSTFAANSIGSSELI